MLTSTETEFFENVHFKDTIFLMSAYLMKAQFFGDADFMRLILGGMPIM
jgi:hypothetical protein